MCQTPITAGILLTNPGDPVFVTNDKPYFLPNIGAGIYYFSDKLFAGVSVPSFLSYRKTGTGSVQAYHSFNEYDFLFFSRRAFHSFPVLKFKPSRPYRLFSAKHKKSYTV